MHSMLFDEFDASNKYLMSKLYMSVIIKAVKNSPYLVNVDEGVKYALCGCGQSNNKLFCDGPTRK